MMYSVIEACRTRIWPIAPQCDPTLGFVAEAEQAVDIVNPRWKVDDRARIRAVDNAFPGIEALQWFDLMEEWYALKNFAVDLHVILVQETASRLAAMEK